MVLQWLAQWCSMAIVKCSNVGNHWEALSTSCSKRCGWWMLMATQGTDGTRDATLLSHHPVGASDDPCWCLMGAMLSHLRIPFQSEKRAGWRRNLNLSAGSLWSTMVHYGPLWSTMVHYGSLWFTMVHYGRLHVVHRLLDPPDVSWCCHSPGAVVLPRRPAGSALRCSGITKRDGGGGDATPGLLLVQLQLGWMILHDVAIRNLHLESLNYFAIRNLHLEFLEIF